jgi:hypothetical protein
MRLMPKTFGLWTFDRKIKAGGWFQPDFIADACESHKAVEIMITIGLPPGDMQVKIDLGGCEFGDHGGQLYVARGSSFAED